MQCETRAELCVVYPASYTRDRKWPILYILQTAPELAPYRDDPDFRSLRVGEVSDCNLHRQNNRL